MFADIEAIKHRYKKEIRPELAHVTRQVYGSYLAANNVKAGMSSYQLSCGCLPAASSIRTASRLCDRRTPRLDRVQGRGGSLRIRAPPGSRTPKIN